MEDRRGAHGGVDRAIGSAQDQEEKKKGETRMRGMKEPRLSGNFEVFYLRFAVKGKKQRLTEWKKWEGKKGTNA
jgi:hypothetical protein